MVAQLKRRAVMGNARAWRVRTGWSEARDASLMLLQLSSPRWNAARVERLISHPRFSLRGGRGPSPSASLSRRRRPRLA